MRRAKHRSGGLLGFMTGTALVSFVSATPAAAQETLGQLALKVARSDVNGTNPLAAPGPQVSLEAREDGGIVAAQFGLVFGTTEQGSLALRVSGPIEKGSETRHLASLLDIPGGVKAEMKLSYDWAKEDWFPSKPLAPICREVNALILGSVLRTNQKREVDAWIRLANAPPDDPLAQYEVLRKEVNEIQAARADEEGRLLKKEDGLTPTEEAWLRSYKNRSLTTFEDMVADVVQHLCEDHNAAHPDALLAAEVNVPACLDPGRCSRDEGRMVRQTGWAGPCTLEGLVQSRANSAAERARAKYASAARKALEAAEKTEAETRADAERSFGAAQAEAMLEVERAVNGSPQELTEARQRAAGVLLAARVRRGERTAEAAAARAKTEAAADPIAAQYEEKALASQETARVEETKKVYSAVVEALSKGVTGLAGLDKRFLVRHPGELTEGVACDDRELMAILPDLPLERRRSIFWRLSQAAPTHLFLTVEAAYASQEFRYLMEPVQIDSKSDLIATEATTEHNHLVRGAASLFVRGWLVTAGYSRKRVWKTGSGAQVCVPRSAPDQLACADLPLQPPSSTDSGVYDLQGKAQFTPSFALALQAQYQPVDDAVDAHALLYFLPEKDRLRGGVDVSYSWNDPQGKDGFKARLFVGVPFAL